MLLRPSLSLCEVITAVNFHEETFSSTPFYSINLEADWLEQVLPPGTVILQNGLGMSRLAAMIFRHTADLKSLPV